MSTSPRAVPFWHMSVEPQHSHQSWTLYTYCNWKRTPSLLFYLFDESARDLTWTLMQSVALISGTGGLDKSLPMSQIVQVQLRDDLIRRHHIRRVPLPGLKPSLPCHVLRPLSTFCRVFPLHLQSCLDQHRRQRRSDRLNPVVSDAPGDGSCPGFPRPKL